jgi:GDP-4-dehydro-6-deoxy-D-mannose reductase
MKVLVTGADGFVGSHLLRALRGRGDTVSACGGPGGPNGVEITDVAAVSAQVANACPDAVIHLAGISSVARSHAHASDTVAVNVVGAVNLLDAVREHAPRARVLLIGSGEEYGRIPAGRRASESDPLSPLSPYAASKVAVEVIARQAMDAYGLDVILVRPFNHLGPGQAPHFVIPSFAQQLLHIARGEQPPVVSVGDLSPVRDFTHVLDVVDAYLLLLGRGNRGETYNVCSGEGLSIQGALDKLQKLAGTRAEIRVEPERLRPAEIPWLVGDPARTERLGWSRRRSIDRALSDILDSLGEAPFGQSSESSSTR